MRLFVLCVLRYNLVIKCSNLNKGMTLLDSRGGNFQ